MPKKLTQAEVDAWLAEHRPDFKPADGWVYVNNKTSIPGRCLVEGCGAECAPRLHHMKSEGKGHCNACGYRAMGAKIRTIKRTHGEAEIRRVAAARGYTVLNIFTERFRNRYAKSGYAHKQFATLCCSCGHEWAVCQGDFCSTGHGCPSCAEFGYDSSKPGAIYLLARSVDGVDQRGYGISNDWPTRIKGYEKFGWLPIDVVEFESGQDARDFETVINRVVGETAGRSVEPDSVYYKNKEAFAEGHGVPMFRDVRSLVSWAVASAGTREGVLV